MMSVLWREMWCVVEQPLVALLVVLQLDERPVVEANAESGAGGSAPRLYDAHYLGAETMSRDEARLLSIGIAGITLDVDWNHTAIRPVRS
jgi:hypothetical protein